jgi:HxlR-like helix-turn-helix
MLQSSKHAIIAGFVVRYGQKPCGEGNKRYRDIRMSVEGISSKVLSGEQRHLEMNGLIEKTVRAGSPVLVEYAISKYGRSLDSVRSYGVYQSGDVDVPGQPGHD